MMRHRLVKDVHEEGAHGEVLRRVSDSLQHVNELIQHAVEAGISIELVRVSRYHDTRGNWGDQMAPAIRQSSSATRN